MFTELFAFDDDNITQQRKVTLWKKICFRFVLKRKIPLHPTEQPRPGFTESRGPGPSVRNWPPLLFTY